MDFVPFIHRIEKKKTEETQIQLPLYIEEYIPQEKAEKEEPTTTTVIELDLG